MGQETGVDKTAFAHFYYFPQEEYENFIKVKGKLLSNYVPVEQEVIKDFDLQASQKLLVEKQLLLNCDNGLIEIYFGLTKSLTIIGVIHNFEVLDKGLPFIDDAEKIKYLIENEFETKIGSTTFYISKNTQTTSEDIDQIKELFNIQTISNKPYFATLLGADVNHFISIDGNYNHLYLLDKSKNSEETIKNIVESDIAIQRIRREAKFYSERRDTFMNENQELDRSINNIFYKQIVSEKDKTDYEKLEGELNDLSKMYGIIASSLHLVEDSTLNLSKDIYKLHRIGKRYEQNDQADNLFTFYKNRFQKYVELFNQDKEEMARSLKNTRAAIDLIQARIELARGKEAIGLQQELVALQVAAGVIEFIVVFYYSIKSWEAIAGKYIFEAVPSYLKLFSVLLLSSSVVAFTHFIAENVKHKKPNSKLFIFIVLAIISLIMMLFFSLTVKGQ